MEAKGLNASILIIRDIKHKDTIKCKKIKKYHANSKRKLG